jgi:hypothetical protein
MQWRWCCWIGRHEGDRTRQRPQNRSFDGMDDGMLVMAGRQGPSEICRQKSGECALRLLAYGEEEVCSTGLYAAVLVLGGCC